MARTKKNKPQQTTLDVEPRKLIGKKVKKIRSHGFIPATVYGPNFKSQSIQVTSKNFLSVYKIAHETGIVTLKYDSQEIPTLIKNLQRHPVQGNILHVDFRKIDLTQKMTTEVPVKIVGNSEAVNQKGGVLLTHSENIMIEALPKNIPPYIEIDISKLKEIGQEIKIADLPKSTSYEFKEPFEKVVISIIAHKEESVTPEIAAPVTEVTTEKVKEEEEVKQEATHKAKKEEPKKEEKEKK